MADTISIQEVKAEELFRESFLVGDPSPQSDGAGGRPHEKKRYSFVPDSKTNGGWARRIESRMLCKLVRARRDIQRLEKATAKGEVLNLQYDPYGMLQETGEHLRAFYLKHGQSTEWSDSTEVTPHQSEAEKRRFAGTVEVGRQASDVEVAARRITVTFDAGDEMKVNWNDPESAKPAAKPVAAAKA